MWCDGIKTSILQLGILRWNVLKSLIDLLSHYWKHETSTSQIFLSNSPKITEPLLLLLMLYFTYMMENGADIKRTLLKYTYWSSSGPLQPTMIGRMFAACLVWWWVLWGRGRAVESHYGRAQQQLCNCTRPLFIILMKCNDSRNKLKIAYPVQII